MNKGYAQNEPLVRRGIIAREIIDKGDAPFNI
jgi:predicted DNA-binding transcriptional regulator